MQKQDLNGNCSQTYARYIKKFKVYKIHRELDSGYTDCVHKTLCNHVLQEMLKPK